MIARRITDTWQALMRAREGVTALTFAMAGAPLLLGAFVALEFVNAINVREDMQEALDAAVLVGARANGMGDRSWEDKARAAFSANFDYADHPNLSFTLDGAIVRGLATQVQKTAFGATLGEGAMDVGVRAAATMGAPAVGGGCLLVLEPSARGVLMNSNSRIQSNCGMQVNSAHTTEAVMVNSNAHLLTPDTKVVGKLRTNANATVDTPAQEGQPVVADPMASLAQPPCVGGPGANVIANSGATTNLPAGCHGVVNINSGGRLRLGPGVHVFTTHLNVGTNAILEGDDVTLFFRTGGGKLQVHNNSTVTLKAPTSGTYKGVLFFQGRTNTEQFIIDTQANLDLDGLIYVPDGEFLINSNATVSPVTSDIAVIVNRILINSNSRLIINRDIGACGASTRLPDAVTAMCAAGVPGSGQLRLVR